jgi:hypothetical protein
MINFSYFLFNVGLLEIISIKSENKNATPLQDLLDDHITEDEFADILEEFPPDSRRVMIKELAGQFKKLISLVSFTSTIASELDMEKAMLQITEQVCKILGADRQSSPQ